MKTLIRLSIIIWWPVFLLLAILSGIKWIFTGELGICDSDNKYVKWFDRWSDKLGIY